MHKIKLLKTHTHTGEVYFAGSVIEVDETTAKWLIERGVGQPEDRGKKTEDSGIKRRSRALGPQPTDPSNSIQDKEKPK